MQSLFSFFRKAENWPLVVIPLCLLLWSQFGAPNLGLMTFNSVSYYNSPYRGDSPLIQKLTPGQPGEPVAKHVVLIVVDALRDDTSREMPTIESLRRIGADRVSIVGQPSFSLPGWTVIGTGAWQEQSGFTFNFAANAIDLDTIFNVAKRGNLTTALVGSASWSQLYDQDVDFDSTPADPHEGDADHYTNVPNLIAYDNLLAEEGLKALKENPDFALLYFTGVDTAGHGYGGASAEYLQAAMNDDKHIAAYLEQIDLTDTVVIITSDHGQIDRNWDGGGGHGGWEPIVLRTPLVVAGVGIKPGTYDDARQADIAPTIAALLGLSIPAHNQGRILLDMIDASPEWKATRAIDNAEQIANRYDSMLGALDKLRVIGEAPAVDRSLIDQARESLDDGDAAAATEQALQSISNTRRQWAAARAAGVNAERWPRLLVALYLLIPVALYGLWWRRARWSWQAPLSAGLFFLVASPVVYLWVRGLSYTITNFHLEERILPFLSARVIDALILMAISMLIVGVWRFRARPVEILRDAVNALFVIGAGIMLQILFYYVLWGVRLDWAFPNLKWGFKYYVDVFQSTVFWPQLPLPVATIMPLLALLVGWLTGLTARLAGRRS